MPVWRVSEPYINLWLEDEPLGYQPPLGPRTSFRLSYKQRNESQLPSNFSSVGQSWLCPWLSGIDATWYYTYGQFVTFKLHNPRGAVSVYDHPEGISSNYFNSLKLLAQTNSYGTFVAAYNYSGGTAFVDGLAVPTKDFWFREGIVVPEPCSPALLLLGGGFLLWARRKLPFK